MNLIFMGNEFQSIISEKRAVCFPYLVRTFGSSILFFSANLVLLGFSSFEEEILLMTVPLFRIR